MTLPRFVLPNARLVQAVSKPVSKYFNQSLFTRRSPRDPTLNLPHQLGGGGGGVGVGGGSCGPGGFVITGGFVIGNDANNSVSNVKRRVKHPLNKWDEIPGARNLDDWKDIGKVLFGFAGDRGYVWLDWLGMGTCGVGTARF